MRRVNALGSCRGRLSQPGLKPEMRTSATATEKAFLTRLAKEMAKVEQELTKVRAKLADPNFTGKVPANVLGEHQQREAAWAEKLGQLEKMREALG